MRRTKAKPPVICCTRKTAQSWPSDLIRGNSTIVGNPVRVPGVEQIHVSDVWPALSASSSGALAYRRAASEIASPVFLTRDGKESGEIASRLERAQNPRISPDGRSLALVVAGELWKYDLDGRPPVKLTFDGALSPIWSRDGQRIVYEGGGTLRAVAADGSGKPEDVAPKGHFHPHSFTPDSREIVAVQLWTVEERSHSYESDRRKPLLSSSLRAGFPPRCRRTAGGWHTWLRQLAHRRFGFGHIPDLARRFACLRMAGRNQCGQRTDASCTTVRTSS